MRRAPRPSAKVGHCEEADPWVAGAGLVRRQGGELPGNCRSRSRREPEDLQGVERTRAGRQAGDGYARAHGNTAVVHPPRGGRAAPRLSCRSGEIALSLRECGRSVSSRGGETSRPHAAAAFAYVWHGGTYLPCPAGRSGASGPAGKGRVPSRMAARARKARPPAPRGRAMRRDDRERAVLSDPPEQGNRAAVGDRGLQGSCEKGWKRWKPREGDGGRRRR